jgi:hypothetical protein
MSKTSFAALPAAQQAGILCNDPGFQRYAATRSGFPGQKFSNTAAAEYIRTVCRVTSRKELTPGSTAHDRFQRLRTDYDEFTGKIAKRR